jgi:hypothetical protein
MRQWMRAKLRLCVVRDKQHVADFVPPCGLIQPIVVHATVHVRRVRRAWMRCADLRVRPVKQSAVIVVWMPQRTAPIAVRVGWRVEQVRCALWDVAPRRVIARCFRVRRLADLSVQIHESMHATAVHVDVVVADR